MHKTPMTFGNPNRILKMSWNVFTHSMLHSVVYCAALSRLLHPLRRLRLSSFQSVFS
jgi:hypothetical protein